MFISISDVNGVSTAPFYRILSAARFTDNFMPFMSSRMRRILRAPVRGHQQEER